MENKTKKILKFLVFPLVLANLALWFALTRLNPDFLLHADFLNIGQGDAIFVQSYLGNQMLIDGGPTDAVLSQLGKSMPFYDRTIDLLVLTHPHADHVAGLVDVLKRYKVKKVLLPEVAHASGVYREFLKLIDEKQVEKIYAIEGQRVWLDNATVLDIYYPHNKQFVNDTNFHEGFGALAQDLNDTSIVGMLIFGKTRMLFTGDAGINIEHELLPKYNLDADLLKVGHHGSRYSTSQEFLVEVTPEYSVIQVGKNSYGHPTQETLDRLKSTGTKIFRNDENKTVKFTSNGSSLNKK